MFVSLDVFFDEDNTFYSLDLTIQKTGNTPDQYWSILDVVTNSCNDNVRSRIEVPTQGTETQGTENNRTIGEESGNINMERRVKLPITRVYTRRNKTIPEAGETIILIYA